MDKDCPFGHQFYRKNTMNKKEKELRRKHKTKPYKQSEETVSSLKRNLATREKIIDKLKEQWSGIDLWTNERTSITKLSG